MRAALLATFCFAIRLAAQYTPTPVVADTRNLVFTVAPLASKGAAVEQATAALKRLPKNPVAVTAFVAENPDAVYETLRAALGKNGKTALAVVGVGGLPPQHAQNRRVLGTPAEPGAKVVLESVSSASKPVNPHGIAFIAGQPASTEKPVAEMAALIEKSFADLRKAHAAAGVESTDVLRMTCFVSSLEDVAVVRRMAEKEFPKAGTNFVQLVRAPSRGIVECETVVRLRAANAEPLRMIQPEGLAKSANYSHVAMLGPGKIAFSGMLLAAGGQDSDARALFSELDKALSRAGSGARYVAMSSLYPTSSAASDLIRRIRFEFYDRNRPPASTMLVFESLPKGAPFAAAVLATAQSGK